MQALFEFLYFLRSFKREITTFALEHDMRDSVDTVSSLFTNRHLRVHQPFVAIFNESFGFRLGDASVKRSLEQSVIAGGMLLVLKVLRVQS